MGDEKTVRTASDAVIICRSITSRPSYRQCRDRFRVRAM